MDWLKMLAIAGMNGGGSGGGVSPEEVTTIVKEQFPGGVGYEEMVELFPEQEVLLESEYKKSVYVFPFLFAQGDIVEVTVDGVLYRGKMEMVLGSWYGDTLLLCDENNAAPIPIPVKQVESGEIDTDFPAVFINGKTGVALATFNSSYDHIATVRVRIVKKVIPISKNFIPDELGWDKVGKSKAFEPITWDGNTEGLESITVTVETMGEVQLYKVKDEYIRIADATAVESCSLYMNDMGDLITQEITPETAEQMGVSLATVTENGFAVVQCYVVVSNGSFLLPGSSKSIPYGVWFLKYAPQDGVAMYPTSVNPSTTVTPISAEYLPNVADIPETWIADLKAALGI